MATSQNYGSRPGGFQLSDGSQPDRLRAHDPNDVRDITRGGYPSNGKQGTCAPGPHAPPFAGHGGGFGEQSHEQQALSHPAYVSAAYVPAYGQPGAPGAPPPWVPQVASDSVAGIGRGRQDETAPYASGYQGRHGDGGLWTLENNKRAQMAPHPPPPKGLQGDDMYTNNHAFIRNVPERALFRPHEPNERQGHGPAVMPRDTHPLAPVYGRYHGYVLGGVQTRSPQRAMIAAAEANGGQGVYVPSTQRNDDISGSHVGSTRQVAIHHAMATRSINRNDDIAQVSIFDI
ncbi:hypothetical protein T492DRAFT_155056 [Pavlovales sp. CCMP2436]|nr:hypothetical protein T492DRAFT_155056 [Pavlovales sp. CCMP2436]